MKLSEKIHESAEMIIDCFQKKDVPITIGCSAMLGIVIDTMKESGMQKSWFLKQVEKMWDEIKEDQEK